LLSHHPWPTVITMDMGMEFAREVQHTLVHEHDINQKIVTSCNPQSNSMVERVHKTLHNMVSSMQIRDKNYIDLDFGFSGMLASCCKAIHSTVHTTLHATPTQLGLGRDAILNVSFEAEWQHIKERSRSLSLKTINTKTIYASHTLAV